MKYKLFLILFVTFLNIYGQNRFLLTYNPGYYLNNSENSLHITDINKIGSYPGFSAAFEKDNILTLNLHLEYNYNYYRKFGMFEFYPFQTNSPLSKNKIYTNYFLTSHNYDVSLLFKLSDNFNYYFGPSFAVYYRTLDYTSSLQTIGNTIDMDDKLVSYCIGINGAVNYALPLSEAKNHFFLYSGLKFRYLHSFRFDARGRNLGNYYQSFFTVQLNLGMGYNF